MNFKKFTTIGLSVLLSTTSYLSHAATNETKAMVNTTAAEANTGEAEKFVADIGNKIIQILVDHNHSLDQRKENFRQVLKDNFNIKAIGRFVLGKYWRQMNNDQQNRYLALFEDTIVESYSEQFDHYDNEKLQIVSAQATNKGSILVKSEILRPQGGESLKVDWQIFKTKSGLRIHDIIVNGVSMSITQRTEYASIIQREGGIDGLLNFMQSKPQNTAPKLEGVK